MGEPHQEVQLQVIAQEAKEANPLENSSSPNKPPITVNKRKRYKRWFRIGLYSTFMLVGQTAATLLGRLYFEKGGKSIWMETLVAVGGFPILLPCYLISSSRNPTSNNNINNDPKQPSLSVLVFVYVSLGLLVALDTYLYSVGLQYLPVSTYSLICSSQLAFNAFFSFFLNSLKFTPYILNSLVLLTISSTLLVFDRTDSSGTTEVSKGKHIAGFICTVAASAGYGLVLSLTQLAFRKVMKSESFRVILHMTVYQSLVATLAILVGLFASGDWKGLKREMEGYELGKASYVLNLSWTAILWQVFAIGCLGLIMEVSSLFSNAISVLGLPVVPIMAVFIFHDKMHGIKVISLVLALWGFLSYIYQQYLDDRKPNTKENRNGTKENGNGASVA